MQLPQVGCVVSELKGTISIDSSQIKPAPAKTSEHILPFIKGIATIGDSTVTILNPVPIFDTLKLSSSTNQLVIK